MKGPEIMDPGHNTPMKNSHYMGTVEPLFKQHSK